MVFLIVIGLSLIALSLAFIGDGVGTPGDAPTGLQCLALLIALLAIGVAILGKGDGRDHNG